MQSLLFTAQTHTQTAATCIRWDMRGARRLLLYSVEVTESRTNKQHTLSPSGSSMQIFEIINDSFMGSFMLPQETAKAHENLGKGAQSGAKDDTNFMAQEMAPKRQVRGLHL